MGPWSNHCIFLKLLKSSSIMQATSKNQSHVKENEIYIMGKIIKWNTFMRVMMPSSKGLGQYVSL